MYWLKAGNSPDKNKHGWVIYLFILNINKVFRDGPVARHLVCEGQEAESSTFLLLLIVHDDDLTDLAELWKKVAEICLRDAWRKTAQKYLKKGQIKLINIHYKMI